MKHPRIWPHGSRTLQHEDTDYIVRIWTSWPKYQNICWADIVDMNVPNRSLRIPGRYLTTRSLVKQLFRAPSYLEAVQVIRDHEHEQSLLGS